MPKRRLMFSLEGQLVDDLELIAMFHGVPVSRVVASALESMAPVHRQMVDAINTLTALDEERDRLAKRYTGEFARKFAPHVEQIEAARLAAESAARALDAKRVVGKRRDDNVLREERRFREGRHKPS